MHPRPFPLACFMALSLSAAHTALARQIPIPTAPRPEFRDMERTTNAAIRADALLKARIFECAVSLVATPSNALEVAFGKSCNGDGVLLPGDESLAMGWDGGSWFVSSPTNRIYSQPQEGIRRMSFSLKLHVSEAGMPCHLSISADGTGNTFATLCATPTGWLFSRSWDTVRLTVRGLDVADECVSVRFGPNSTLLIMR